MNARHRRFLLSVAVLACNLLSAVGARAEIINAASYAIGTNISNALPGVTLSYEMDNYGTITESPLVISTGYPVGNQNNELNTLGSYTDDLQILNGPPPPPIDQLWAGIHAEFAHPINSITIQGFVSDSLPSILYAYDTSGNLIGYSVNDYHCLYFVSVATGKRTCFLTGETTSFASTTPIGSIVYGGYLDEGYATEIDIPGLVSEPGTLGMLAVGLMGLGLTARRRAQSQR